jgi:hypothetical protein
METPVQKFRILFLCTWKASRSIFAELLLEGDSLGIGSSERRQAGSLCYFTPSRRHSGCTAITLGMAVGDLSTGCKPM